MRLYGHFGLVASVNHGSNHDPKRAQQVALSLFDLNVSDLYRGKCSAVGLRQLHTIALLPAVQPVGWQGPSHRITAGVDLHGFTVVLGMSKDSLNIQESTDVSIEKEQFEHQTIGLS